MPRGASEDIAHEQVTDHRIQIPAQSAKPVRSARSGELVPIGNEAPGSASSVWPTRSWGSEATAPVEKQHSPY